MRQRSARGFTLIEIMIAVTIVTLVLSMVYGVVTSVSRSKDRIEGEGEVYHRARIIFDRIGREIRGVYPATKDGKFTFTGGETSENEPFLELCTTASTPVSGMRGGLSLVRYELREDTDVKAGSKVLLRSEVPLFGEEGIKVREYRLATGIDSMQLRFSRQENWQDEGQGVLPELVELTLTMQIGEGKIPFRTVWEVPQVKVLQVTP
jgi:general secretion pathway protein J